MAVVAVAVAVAALVAWGLFLPIPYDLMDEPEYMILAEGYRHGLFHRMPLEPGAPVNLPAGPLLPLALAAFQLIAGDGLVTAKHAMAALYPVLIGLLALLFLRRFHPLWAVIAVLTIACTFWLAEFSWQVMTEIPFAILVTCWLLALGRAGTRAGRAGWAGAPVLLSLFGFFLRPAGIVLALSLGIWAGLRRWWVTMVVALAIVVVVPAAWNHALKVEAEKVGATFGGTHLSFVASHGSDQSLRGVILGLAVSRPAEVRGMVTRHLPDMLRFAQRYEEQPVSDRRGPVATAAALFFLASTIVGCVVLLKEQRGDGVVGILVPLYLVTVLLFQSTVRFLVPIFPFMVYAAMVAWGRLTPSPTSRHRWLLRTAGIAAALIIGGQALALNGADIYQAARGRSAWRAGNADAAPYPQFTANYLAAEWIGKAFDPRTETIGSFKPTAAYLAGHEYSVNLPRADTDLASLRWYLDKRGVTLIIEDGWTPWDASLTGLLREGEGKWFTRLTSVRVGSSVAAVWRYRGTKDGAPAVPKIAPWG